MVEVLLILTKGGVVNATLVWLENLDSFHLCNLVANFVGVSEIFCPNIKVCIFVLGKSISTACKD